MEKGIVYSGKEMFARIAKRWSEYGPPVIIFNKSHSGSRLLAKLIASADVYLGHDLNDSEDAADILRMVRPLVEGHYPHYASLLRDGDVQLEELIDTVFAYHLRDIRPGQRWGWKLCETVYILPILFQIFPDAYYVHLIRDGRDVAFSNHVAPVEPFWRKIFFDTTHINVWNGYRITRKNYRRTPHVFNARHWVNSVTVGRHYGSMIGPRYLELRYEDLVTRPETTARDVFDALGMSYQAETISDFAGSVTLSSMGKYERQSWFKRRQALAVLQPALSAFGYQDPSADARSLFLPWGRRTKN